MTLIEAPGIEPLGVSLVVRESLGLSGCPRERLGLSEKPLVVRESLWLSERARRERLGLTVAVSTVYWHCTVASGWWTKM